MSFTFNTDIIYPKDPTATPDRISQYKEYYKIKYDILKNNFPEAKIIGEIGVRAGYSAWTFLQACPSAEYYGFDANNGTHGGQGGEDGSFNDWAQKLLKEYNTKFYQTNTQSVSKLPTDIKFDFIHVDGDHSVQGVKHDLDICLDALSDDNKAFLLIDDYTYINSVKIGVDEWLNEKKNIVFQRFIPSLRGEVIIKRFKKKGGKY